MIKGVMFDFPGTLFRIESAEQWPRAVATEAGLDVPEGELDACVSRLKEFGAQPGGVPPRTVPPRLDGRCCQQHRLGHALCLPRLPRPRRRCVDALVDAYFLSFERGVTRADPGIFQMACDTLGVAPCDALVGGDEPAADTGATLGCRVHLVDPLPVDQRPGALAEVLQLL